VDAAQVIVGIGGGEAVEVRAADRGEEEWVGVLSDLLGWSAVGLGLAGMSVTMLVPDRMALYMPVFHVGAVWLAAMGATVLRGGINGGAMASVLAERL
jgi:hypothetical protein